MRELSEIIKEEKTSLRLITIGMVIIGVAIILFIWCDYSFSLSSKINSEKFGQLGDFIGGIAGSIWALAGVLLFYTALTEQRKDIKTNQKALENQIEALNNQVKEFELQRKELESSRKVYEQQNKTLKIQQFDSNFYSLLNICVSIKNNLNNNHDSKDYFRTLFNNIKISFDEADTAIKIQSKYNENYLHEFNLEKGQLSHYFKSVYRLLKVIATTSGFSRKEKTFYSKILRAQISDYEQLILYFNSQSYLGIKARPLILEYNLLKHIDIFNKPEFEFYFDIQKEDRIKQFAQFITEFLSTHINDSYDIEFDKSKIIEEFKPYNCQVGIFFEEEFVIKFFFDIDISSHGIKLTEEQLSNFLHILLNERIVMNTYIDPSLVEISKFKTETGDNKILGYKITTGEKLRLNRDTY